MKIYKRVNELLGTEYKNDKSICWTSISMYQKLSEEFIREFQDKVAWHYISEYQRLSEDFIREFQNEVDWKCISGYQKLSECFIREFQDKIDWISISMYQKLSEDFIREFQNKVYWCWISKYQKLSENFIREFQDRIHWYYIFKHQKLSNEFISEFADKLNDLRHELIDNSWHYKDTEYKKQAVISTGLYKCYDDYFIAYKGIRSDRYSKYNFQYKYEPGGIYESWCDCSDELNSFGLSVWTEKEARSYCNELVVKVKVRYEDIGRLAYYHGKIRCFRIEVLN